MLEKTVAPRTEPVAGQKMTADEFEQLPKFARKYELIEGEIRMTPAGLNHDRIAVELIFRLRLYLESNPIGQLYASSAGFRLPNDDVLSPDVAFVLLERLPGGRSPEGFGRFAPDLAVEIVSPGDTAAEIDEKVNIYLAFGTRLVWIVNPRGQSATVYRADGTLQRVRADGVLDGEGVLPGFTCRLGDVL